MSNSLDNCSCVLNRFVVVCVIDYGRNGNHDNMALETQDRSEIKERLVSKQLLRSSRIAWFD